MIKNKKNEEKTADEYMEIGNKFFQEGEYVKAIENFREAFYIKIMNSENFPHLLQILRMIQEYYTMGTECEIKGERERAIVMYLSGDAMLDKQIRIINEVNKKEKKDEGNYN